MANATTVLAPVPLAGLFRDHPMLLVALRLSDSAGTTLAENFYWRGRDPAAYRSLGDLPAVPLMAVMAPASPENGEDLGVVTLTNRSPTPALNIKLTLIDSRGARILPAFYSDNYIALMPGESRAVTIRYHGTPGSAPGVAIRGWNVEPQQRRCRCSTLTGGSATGATRCHLHLNSSKEAGIPGR